MILEPLQVSGTVFDTNDNNKPKTSTQQANQTLYRPTFRELLQDLMLEQREQM